MLYLAIETASIPLYIPAGFILADDRSTEAGYKYLLFGTLASTVMLYGFSLVFGFAQTTNLDALAGKLADGELSSLLAFGGVALILVGLGFKVSLVPFHFWARDTYEGAPTPVAGILSTASKAAGLAVLVRLFIVVFPQVQGNWQLILAILASAVGMGRPQAQRAERRHARPDPKYTVRLTPILLMLLLKR